MNKSVFVALATTMLCAVNANAATTYNSTPTGGWHFGTGNDYSPANSAVATFASGTEFALRFHETFQPAPASSGTGVYTFAVGTSPLSYDWSVLTASRSVFAATTITVSKIGGATFTYNPATQPNDNELDGSVQNSLRLNFFNAFDPTFYDGSAGLYRVTIASGADSLSVDARIGAVPEPATWAMMLGGFGLAGAAMRRRTRTSVTYA